jgi:hypothetical protein
MPLKTKTPKKKILIAEQPIPAPKRIYNTIDELLGATGNSKYGTLDLAEYETRINALTPVDLYSHAQSLGLRGSDDRARMLRTLKEEFIAYVRPYLAVRFEVTEQKYPGDDIKQLMAQGR